MKVTVDTRHDSLEEALATVQAAFGSTGNSPSAEHRRNRRATPQAATHAKPGEPDLGAARLQRQEPAAPLPSVPPGKCPPPRPRRAWIATQGGPPVR